MPYIAGRSLQDRLDTDGPLELIEILRISQQIASGLAASHAQGLVHRDIKPANVLLQDGVERVTITDFGLARAVDDASMTRTGVIAGTPQFMSPEQARGDSVECRSDLFSLGSVMYTMCTGHPPFRAETSYGVLRRITDDAPRNIRELNPVIPAWLVTLVNLLLEKPPEKRFESASKLEVVLKQCIAHVEQPAKQPLPSEVLAKRATKRRLWLVAAILLLIAIPLYQVPIAPRESPAPITQTPLTQTPIAGALETKATRKAGPLETPDARASSIAVLVEKLEAAIDTESQVSHRDSLEIPFANGEPLPISIEQYEPWTLTLEECISIALQTSSFVKSLDHATPEDPQVSLANFEVQVRNLVRDVENEYWELFVSNQRISVAVTAQNQAITVAHQ